MCNVLNMAIRIFFSDSPVALLAHLPATSQRGSSFELDPVLADPASAASQPTLDGCRWEWPTTTSRSGEALAGEFGAMMIGTRVPGCAGRWI